MDALKQLYKNTLPINDLRDVYKRFNFSYDLNNSFYKPEVSEFLFNKGFKPAYPNGAKFAICISHDIDELFNKANPVRFVKSAKALNFNGVKNELRLLTNKRGFDYKSAVNILELERKHNIHSTYFFLSLLQGEQDHNYTPDAVKEFFDRVSKNGSEIGLHGGHEAAFSQLKLQGEKELLEKASAKKIKGYRGHYLKFDFPKTWEYLKNCGVVYDSTFSYPDVVGFRNGMCYPFHPLSQQDKFIELPLILSDHIFDKYMRTDQKTMMAITKHLLQKVSSVNGVFTFLWHNGYYKQPFIELFEMITEYGKSQNAWFASGIELCEWWQSQGYFNKYSEIASEIFVG